MKTFDLNGQEVRLSEMEDVEPEECTKIFHDLVDAKTGKSIKVIDWTPYDHMSEEDVELYIALGCPSREDLASCGPLHREDLVKIKEIRAARKHAVKLFKGSPNVEI